MFLAHTLCSKTHQWLPSLRPWDQLLSSFAIPWLFFLLDASWVCYSSNIGMSPWKVLLHHSYPSLEPLLPSQVIYQPLHDPILLRWASFTIHLKEKVLLHLFASQSTYTSHSEAEMKVAGPRGRAWSSVALYATRTQEISKAFTKETLNHFLKREFDMFLNLSIAWETTKSAQWDFWVSLLIHAHSVELQVCCSRCRFTGRGGSCL